MISTRLRAPVSAPIWTLVSTLSAVVLAAPFASAQSLRPAGSLVLPQADRLQVARVQVARLDLAQPSLLGDSSSATQPEASETVPDAPSVRLYARAGAGAAAYQATGNRERPGSRPFSALGVAIKIGTGGIGFDVATPLAGHFNLRGGAQFFSASPTFTEDGIQYNSNLVLRTAAVSLDYFPWRGSFHISPGFTVYNNTHINASAAVSGGQTFTLNDQQYTSSTADPVHGSANLTFGNRTAPRLTVGFGNMIPRSRKHWSFPTEIGFQYISDPTVTLQLAGTACNQYGCENVATDPTIQANVQAEQQELNSDLRPLRFYPILSTGVSYKFGR